MTIAEITEEKVDKILLKIYGTSKKDSGTYPFATNSAKTFIQRSGMFGANLFLTTTGLNKFEWENLGYSSGEFSNKQISTADELKDFFTIFNAQHNDRAGKPLYYNQVIITSNYVGSGPQSRAAASSTTVETLLTDKPFPKFDYEAMYIKYILPLLQQYYLNFKSSETVDRVIKESVKKWYDSQTTADFIKKINIISDALRNNPTATDIDIDVKGTRNITINVERFFTALFTGVYAAGKFSKQKVQRTEYRDVGSGIIQPVEVTDEVEVSENLQNVFEALGYSDYLVDQSDINGFFSENKIPPTVESLQYAETADPELYQQIIEKTLQLPPLNEEGRINLRQCALITGLLHDFKDENGFKNFRNYIQDPDFNSPLGRAGLEKRIYCVKPNIKGYEPNQFVNLCTIDPAIKPTLETNNQIDPNSMYKFLFWVYKGTNGLREVKIPLTSQNANEEDRAQYRKLRQAQNLKNNNTLAPEELESQIQSIVPGVKQEQIEDKITELGAKLKKKNKADDLFYFLKETNIKFEGTNPSTARNDVQVTLTFELSSISALDSTIVTLSGEKDGLPPDKTIEIRIMDLVTITSTNKTSTKDGDNNNLMSNAYSPDYSRLRLKISPNTLDQNVLVVDIATIDHQISRDSTTGKTTLTINYRGYFETVMSMPFNDALADEETMISRWKRQQEGLNVLRQQNCKPSTIREAMRIEAQSLAREGRKAGFSSILKRLLNLNLLHVYNLKPTYESSRYGNVLDPRENYVESVYYGNNYLIGGEKTTEEDVSKLTDQIEKKNKEETDKKEIRVLSKIEQRFNSHFFFLGDLMHVVTDCLYTTGSTEGIIRHQEWVKDLNMRFILSTINVPNPNDLDGAPLQINPACIPIDVLFFTQWFNSVVVNKNLSYYPVGIFMRDLIERLVNNIIQETCFSLLLPDQTPAQLRMGFFTDDSDNWFRCESSSWFNPLSAFGYGKSIDRPLFKRALSSAVSNNSVSVPINSKNYCVIYQQFSTFSSQLNSSRTGRLKDDPYTISLYYGIKNNQHNFLSNVSFSKTNSPYLREARYTSNAYGSLSLLSNVYDLSFSFVRRKANTFFLPGNIINFYLLDWGKTWGKNNPPWSAKDDKEFGQANPHDDGTISNIVGMGGYFIILSVEYVLGETPGEFEIKIATKFNGTDAVKHPANSSSEAKNVEDSKACADAFNVIADRANELYESGDELFEKASESYAANGITFNMFDINNTLAQPQPGLPSEQKQSDVTPNASEPLVLPGVPHGGGFDTAPGYGVLLTQEMQTEIQIEQKLSEIYTGWTKSTADKIAGKKSISELTKDNSGFFKAIVDAVVASGLNGVTYMEDNSYYYHVFANGDSSVIKVYNRQ